VSTTEELIDASRKAEAIAKEHGAAAAVVILIYADDRETEFAAFVDTKRDASIPWDEIPRIVKDVAAELEITPVIEEASS
jgi:hypothetical protein